MIPRAVGRFGFGDRPSKVSAFEIEVGLAVGGELNAPESFRIPTIITTAPLTMVKKMVFVGFDVTAVPTFGAGNGAGADFTDEDALERYSGDLEIIDVGLVIAPGH